MEKPRTGWSAALVIPEPAEAGRTVSGGTRAARSDRLFGLFLGLVAGARACSRTDGATDHGARRSRDRATDHGAGNAAAGGPGARPGFVVAFGRLTGDGATGRADHAADHGARRATNGHADRGTTERPGPGSNGLAAAFLVLGCGVVVCDPPVVASSRLSSCGWVCRSSLMVSTANLLSVVAGCGPALAPSGAVDPTLEGGHGCRMSRNGRRLYQRCDGRTAPAGTGAGQARVMPRRRTSQLNSRVPIAIAARTPYWNVWTTTPRGASGPARGGSPESPAARRPACGPAR